MGAAGSFVLVGAVINVGTGVVPDGTEEITFGLVTMFIPGMEAMAGEGTL